MGPTWQLTNGTNAGSNVNGTEYTVNVTWTVAGTGTVRFRSTRDGLLATLNVTVTSCGLGNPSPNYNSFARCGPGTLTLQATPGSGGNTNEIIYL